jgi:3-oxoacyl-[acyl-carrier protein] reductase
MLAPPRPGGERRAQGLEGKVALVTGAGSATGIGFATARVLGRDAAMLAIASTTDRIQDREAELRSLGYTASGFGADLTSLGQAKSLVESVLELYGRIDVLVNNAGMVQVGVDSPTKRFVDLSEDDWNRDVALNLMTTFNVTRCVVPGMVQRGYGRIVNVSSTTGPLVAIPGSAGYGAAKAAGRRADAGAGPGGRSARHHGELGGAGLDTDGLVTA